MILTHTQIDLYNLFFTSLFLLTINTSPYDIFGVSILTFKNLNRNKYDCELNFFRIFY